MLLSQTFSVEQNNSSWQGREIIWQGTNKTEKSAFANLKWPRNKILLSLFSITRAVSRTIWPPLDYKDYWSPWLELNAWDWIYPTFQLFLSKMWYLQEKGGYCQPSVWLLHAVSAALQTGMHLSSDHLLLCFLLQGKAKIWSTDDECASLVTQHQGCDICHCIHLNILAFYCHYKQVKWLIQPPQEHC